MPKCCVLCIFYSLYYECQTFCKCMNMQNYIVKWAENDGHQFCLSWVQNNTIVGAHYSSGNDPRINKITRDQILSLGRRLLVYFCLVSKSSYVNKLLLYRVYQGCEDVNMYYFITKSPFIYNKHVASIKPALGYPHSNLLKSMNL